MSSGNKIKLFATDIDHTLYNSEEDFIPEENYKALEDLMDNGITLCLASSRVLFGVLNEVEKLKLKERNGYISVGGGTLTIRCSDWTKLTDAHFSQEEVEELYEISKTIHTDFMIAQDSYIVTTRYGKINDYDFNSVGYDIIVAHDFRKYWKEPVYYAAFIDNEMNMYQLRDQLKEKYGDRFTFSVPQPPCLEVIKKGSSKFAGVSAVAKDLGISMNEVASIGDNDNDIPMLEASALSACVANGSENAKKTAQFIVKEDREAGVAQFIYEHVLNEK